MSNNILNPKSPICTICAEKNGGQFKTEHTAPQNIGQCTVCLQTKTVLTVEDFDWKVNEERRGYELLID